MTVVGERAHPVPRWWRFSPLHRLYVRRAVERRIRAALKALIMEARGGQWFVRLDDLTRADQINGFSVHQVVPYGDQGDRIEGFLFYVTPEGVAVDRVTMLWNEDEAPPIPEAL